MKAYLGYDLGDGETITELEVLSQDAVNNAMTTISTDMLMPDMNDAGKAIPSTYGIGKNGAVVFAPSITYAPDTVKNICLNFKRCPSDLLKSQPDSVRTAEIIELLKSGVFDKENCPELYTAEMQEFADKVVTFTNAIFENETYKLNLHAKITGCSEISFCVGHPTKWNELDKAIYYAILSESVLGSGTYDGIPSSLILAAESRAAFLRLKYNAKGINLPEGSYVLLIDIGSSTIDVTAMTTSSKNYSYNTGSNYLGVRSIDYIVRDMYVNDLRKNPGNSQLYDQMIKVNPDMNTALTLACRLAKEEVFRTTAGGAKIYFANFPPFSLDKAALINAIKTVPIDGLLKYCFSIPDSELTYMCNMSWQTMFREFLKKTRSEMESQNINVGGIILTGSASKMPVVRETVKEIFSEVGNDRILNDSECARTISKGLALVGPYDERARQFQNEADEFCNIRVPQLISSTLPGLADSLSGVIEEVITLILLAAIETWKEGGVDTLDKVTEYVKKRCEAENLQNHLNDCDDYVELCNNWSTQLGSDIAAELNGICKNYGVNNIDADNLNIMVTGSAGTGIAGFSVNPVEALTSALSNVAGIAATIIAFMFTTVGIGLVVLAAALFAGEAIQEKIEDWIQTVKLPLWLRRTVTEKKVREGLADCNLKQKIMDDILSDKNQKKMAGKILAEIRPAVMERVDGIKYLIQ